MMMTNKSRPRTKAGEIKIELNIPQMQAVSEIELFKKKYIFLEYSRGTGKSFVLAYFIMKAVREMPRATGILVGNTYMQILSRTLPSTKEGLASFGLYESLDYVIGRSGVTMGFELPFQAPSNWKNVIHFRNGHIILMVSLDMADSSGRGINSYYVIGDEAALLDKERLYLNVHTTNRSYKTEFKYSPMQNAEIFASSTPLTKKGKWFTSMEKKALKNPDKYAFLRANAFANFKNLERSWFRRMEANSPSKLHYDAEILNIRPPAVQDGFYAKLNPDIHYYGNKYDTHYLEDIGNEYSRKHYTSRQDTDVVRSARVQMNLDFGKRINSMTVSQYLKSINEVRFLKEFFNKAPYDMIDLLPEFIDYYKDHEEKVLELYHDVSGYAKEKGTKESMAERVMKYLRIHGWKVINKTPKTNNPLHMNKYDVLNEILAERDHRFPRIRINKDNCKNLCISMENAETKIKENSEFGKDKTSELSRSLPQEQATHLSDTLDYNIYWQFYLLVKNGNRTPFAFPIS